MEIEEERKREVGLLSGYWGLPDASLSAVFHEKTERRVYMLTSGSGKYILKGIPDTKDEQVIAGNVSTHEFLGNKKGIAPKLLYTADQKRYIRTGGFYYYMMECIDGRQLAETPQDEYDLGCLARLLHSFGRKNRTDILFPSALSGRKERFYSWFVDRPFKPLFDALLDGLPDFFDLDQCLIHSDLGPHNAMRRKNGAVVLIDLDDSGIGSRHLDLGWAFIMQFVDFDHATGAMRYRFDLALAFLCGYYHGRKPETKDGRAAGRKDDQDDTLTRAEYDLLWQGAIFMHISYMKTYGPYAVDSLWKILQFGIGQKEKLWEQWNELHIPVRDDIMTTEKT
ncbi:MAG: aminoglycoside phosphotransferase family protein [Lachnospiraceae bacterium]|nr:aminoglycoside phosphotransferase family protein [Lachnospiraceae bacterium]